MDKAKLIKQLEAMLAELRGEVEAAGELEGGFLPGFSEYGGLRHPALDEARQKLAADGRPQAARVLAATPEYLVLNPDRFPELFPAKDHPSYALAEEARNNEWAKLGYIGSNDPITGAYVIDQEDGSSKLVKSHAIFYSPPGMTLLAAVSTYAQSRLDYVDRLIELGQANLPDYYAP